MKQFVAVSRNIYYSKGDDGVALTPHVELIFILTEPKYVGRDLRGGLTRSDELSDCRFRITLQGLQDLSQWLLDYKEDVESEVKEIVEDVYSMTVSGTVMSSKKK